MTTFYLIRHAEKLAPHDVLAGRTPEIRLTETGKRQAANLAAALAHAPIQSIQSSPLERTRATAQPLATSRNLSVHVCDAFDEFDFGDWTGRTFSSLQSDPEWRVFNEVRSNARPPNGETMLAVQQRFVEGMLRLTRDHPHEGIAIVSHADPIRAALLYFMGAPLDHWSRIEISIASTSILTVGPHGVVIRKLNELPNALTPARTGPGG